MDTSFLQSKRTHGFQCNVSVSTARGGQGYRVLGAVSSHESTSFHININLNLGTNSSQTSQTNFMVLIYYWFLG